MSERDGFPAGVPSWVDTLQPDADAAAAFYGGLFGWEFEGPGEMPGHPPGRYLVARLRGRDVAGIGAAGDHRGPPVDHGVVDRPGDLVGRIAGGDQSSAEGGEDRGAHGRDAMRRHTPRHDAP